MYTYTGSTISSVYEQMMKDVIAKGVRSNPRGKWTRSLNRVCVEFKNSVQNKFLLIPNRNLNYAFALAEIIWILSGRGDYEYIGFYNKAMGKYLDGNRGLVDFKGMTTTHDLHAAYGKRIRRAGSPLPMTYFDLDGSKYRYIDKYVDIAEFQGLFQAKGLEIDQLQVVIDKLQDDMSTRQAVVDLWDVSKDNLFKALDHPCNTQIFFDVIANKLNMTVIRRSNDIVWGLPYNIVQFSSIQEYMAGWLGVKIGTHTEFINNLHIYEDEYQDIYKFFEDKITSEESFVLDLEPISYVMNITGEDSKCSKSEMDRLLKYFLGSELEWRARIKSDTHEEVLKLYIERWLGELNHITANKYWQQIYLFLLCYHLYKAKHHDLVLRAMVKMSNLFKLMAVETFKNLNKEIIKMVDLKLNSELHNKMKSMYKDLLK